MEMGTLGDRRQAGFDALYAEAKTALSHSANALRAVTERLRETHGEAFDALQRDEPDAGGRSTTAQTAELARGKQMLARLELAVREIEGTWLFLERGRHGDSDTGRPTPERASDGSDPASPAMQILEAQEEERLRLADELHDGPAQALANTAFQVDVISNLLRRDPAAAHEEVRALRARLDRDLEEIRGFISQLRPPMDDATGLDAALKEIAERLASETGVTIELQFEAPSSLLDDRRRMAVLRVAQEALRNVRKHAGARNVQVATRTVPGGGSDGGPAWVIEIRDDGRGFGVEEALARTGRRHFGLRFMRERAGLIGGRLEIVSTPDRGTLVRLTLDGGERR